MSRNDFTRYGDSIAPRRQQPIVNNNNSSSGLGFTGALFLVFLVLKLTHVINWSWWWVTAPLWGGLAIFLALAVVVLIIGGIVALVGSKRK